MRPTGGSPLLPRLLLLLLLHAGCAAGVELSAAGAYALRLAGCVGGHIGAVVALVLYSCPDARAGTQAACSAACLTFKLA